MKIKALLLDFDNTIYPEKEYFINIFREFCVQKKKNSRISRIF